MSGDSFMKFCGAHGVSGSLVAASSSIAAQACGDMPREAGFNVIDNQPSHFISAGLASVSRGNVMDR